ncbi:MAG: cysteine desulfurase [Verrucomicrobia bacterium]|nr:cysteine desulfurase [Verrucomicrobiota bacterium]
MDASGISDPLLEQARRAFPALWPPHAKEGSVSFDNAATTHKPVKVIEALQAHYLSHNANVHRAGYALAENATKEFEGTRRRVASFLGAANSSEIVFTRGTTESINLVAEAWGSTHIRPGDEILLTPMEHHSNLVPWQRLAARAQARLRFLPLDPRTGGVETREVAGAISPKVRLFAMTHISNVTGACNPIDEWIGICRRHGVVSLVDAAQSAAHRPLDAARLGCDFLACSAHKMYGPTGVGVLYGRSEILHAMPPWQSGGQMVESVDWEQSTYARPPHRFEAGTPPIAEVAGLRAAIEFLGELGWARIQTHESALVQQALDLLGSLPFVTVLPAPPGRAGIVSFLAKDTHPEDLAAFLNTAGFAVRAGRHCAEPFLRALGADSALRISFALYNTPAEVTRFVTELRRIHRELTT